MRIENRGRGRDRERELKGEDKDSVTTKQDPNTPGSVLGWLGCVWCSCENPFFLSLSLSIFEGITLLSSQFTSHNQFHINTKDKKEFRKIQREEKTEEETEESQFLSGNQGSSFMLQLPPLSACPQIRSLIFSINFCSFPSSPFLYIIMMSNENNPFIFFCMHVLSHSIFLTLYLCFLFSRDNDMQTVLVLFYVHVSYPLKLRSTCCRSMFM